MGRSFSRRQFVQLTIGAGIAAGAVTGCSKRSEKASRAWSMYKGDATSSSYSSLSQINRSNVNQLELAWRYTCPDPPGRTIECNPLVVGNRMYVTSPRGQVISLDAATGTEIWTFNPYEDPSAADVNRGLTYWESDRDRRIFVGAGPYIYALRADTGTPVSSFGTDGRIDLRTSMDRAEKDLTASSSPGIIYNNLLIVGSDVREGPAPASPGHIRAFDALTGSLAWTFHTIPRPGEFGHETWPADAWKTVGGANCWGGMSLDEERGLVYVPTGSASYDHHGGDRAGDNLFANCILALDAATGERVWHFQAVHHDVWDYDLPCPPNLVGVRRGFTEVDAVAQATKMGHLLVLDRETGEPLYPIEEKPVPQSTVPGEKTAPTQPFPPSSLRYARQGFNERAVTNRTPEARKTAMEHLDRFGPSVLFSPPSRKGTITVPQFNGGTDWGGAAYDPRSNSLYVNASNVPELIRMMPAPDTADHPYPFIAAGHQPIRDNEGYPISSPPWGTLSRIDLDRGKIDWQVPLGDHPELALEGPERTGTFNIGGPIVTAGNAGFIGATKDEQFRAFDLKTGKTLWKTQLPAGGYATPATYMVDGRQFVVIAAGGAGKPGTKPGNEYLAFALP